MSDEKFPDEDIVNMKRLRILALGEEAESAGWCSGDQNLSLLILEQLRSSPKPEESIVREFCDLLPWVLTRRLADNIFIQEIVLNAALACPDVHAALAPHLSNIMAQYAVEGEGAGHFLSPAHIIAQFKNLALISAAEPHFPEALRRSAWSPHNFGSLACSWLDIGGDSSALMDPIKYILGSQQSDDETSYSEIECRETRLGKHLCTPGFVALLNHPRLKENKPLREMLYPFAGGTPAHYKSHNPPPVLTSIQGDVVQVFWQPYVYNFIQYSRAEKLSELRHDFIDAAEPADIAQTARELFNRMSQVPRRDISVPAHAAVKSIGAEWKEDIENLVRRRNLVARLE